MRVFALLASATTVAGCSDINSDGAIDVNDLLGVLSGFGSDGSDGSDINSDGVVDVNDLLGVLSDFGGTPSCTPSAEPAPVVEAPLWCPDSPAQMCRMMCPDASPCRAGQCNMREGNCCASNCVDFVPAAEEAANCAQGEDCGGQEWTDCGTSCPAICGQPAPMMCNMMCNSEYQCPGDMCFNEATGTCQAGGGGGGDLPPGIAPGRPFLNAKLVPETATPYSVVSDWSIEL